MFLFVWRNEEKKHEKNFHLLLSPFPRYYFLFLVMLSVHFILDFITFTINIIFFQSSVCFYILWNAEWSVFQGKWTRNTKDRKSNETKNTICLRNLFLQPIVLFVTFSLILSSKWLGKIWAPDLHFVQQENKVFVWIFRNGRILA